MNDYDDEQEYELENDESSDCEPDFYDHDHEDGPEFDEREELNFDDFANPGGNSALRAATASNPRIHPCPTCESPNKLTQKDVGLGYCCDDCAEANEGFGP